MSKGTKHTPRNTCHLEYYEKKMTTFIYHRCYNLLIVISDHNALDSHTLSLPPHVLQPHQRLLLQLSKAIVHSFANNLLWLLRWPFNKCSLTSNWVNAKK